MFQYIFKLQELLAKGINRFFEWSFQRQANKQFKNKNK